MLKLRKNKKGFTLVELIVVVAIMAVLAGTVAGVVVSTQNKTKNSQANSSAQQIAKAVAELLNTDLQNPEQTYLSFDRSGTPRLSGSQSTLLKNVQDSYDTGAVNSGTSGNAPKAGTNKYNIAINSSNTADISVVISYKELGTNAKTKTFTVYYDKESTTFKVK